MNKFFILLILIFSMGSLRAQTDIFNWKLTTEGGSFVFEDQFSFPEDLKHAAFGLHIERTLNRSFSTGLSLFTGRPMGGILKNAGYAGLSFGFRWDNGWLLGERVFLAPYHTLEAGYLSGEKRLNGEIHHDFAAGTTHGLKFRLSHRFSARLSFGFYFPLDYNQGNKWSDLAFYQQWKAGFSYHFGARKIKYRGPAFNAGSFFPIPRETSVLPETSLQAVAEDPPHSLTQPKVIIEETIVVLEQDTLPKESQIEIIRTDSLIQISVKRGEAVIINISPHMFGQPAVEKKEEAFSEEGALEVEPEEAQESIEAKAPEEEVEEEGVETIEETEAETIREKGPEETKEGLTEEIAEEVAEETSEETLQEVAEKIEETEAVEAVEELKETEAVVETVIVEGEVEEEIPETIEKAENEARPEEAREEPAEGKKAEQEPTEAQKIITEEAETTQAEEAIQVPEPLPVVTSPVTVPDSLENRYPIVLTFPFNSASLQEAHQDILHLVAKDLEAHPALLCKISGHADKSGDPVYNMILSGQRAVVIRECLEGYGIDPERISIEALGDQFASEVFSEKERKVEIQIFTPPAQEKQK
ncbi:MAG: OmpA family protein [Bacteroidales bacterium]|jgi:outer membrane protein OmpA-like peptidoglycan-associated protein|nr:OmpA family protein [Bacteroidales bacterium]NLM93364.1 OmpA family protein [Bacteroidales bacterium]